MLKEQINATGHLQIFKNGKLERDVNNLVVTDGLEWIAARMYDTAIPDEMSHMHLGTGGSATVGSVTGSVDLSSGHDWNAQNESFFIDVNNGEFTAEVTLSANCANIAAVVAEINTQLSAAGVDGVEAIVSTNYAVLQTTNKGLLAKFHIHEPDANNALATIGWLDGEYAGTGGAALADSDLTTAHGDARTALTSTTVSNNEVEYVATFGAAVCTGAITEAGIFNAVSSGTMLCRTVFDVVNKGSNDIITVTWTITIQ